MNQNYIKLTLILLTISLTVLFVFIIDSFKQNNSIFISKNQETVKKEPIYQVNYLVPVVEFFSESYDFDLEKVSEYEIVTFEENEELVAAKFSLFTLISEENLAAELRAGKVALLTPEQVKPQYKTLKVDGQLFWDKDFETDNYPLKILLEVEKKEEFLAERHLILAGGEIIPARAVDRLGLNVFNNYTYLFDLLRDDLEKADINIALLENPLNGNPSPCTGCVIFVGDENVAAGLAEVGFNMLSLAGNHAGDGGQQAYARTIELLQQSEIQYTGVGKTDEELLTPAIIQMGETNVGMLAADDVAYFFWGKNTSDNIYGTNSFSQLNGYTYSVDLERVAKLKDIKESFEIDYLIIYMSWGIEYTNKPTDHQRNLAAALVENGADLILGSHPHWVQSIDFIDDVAVVYSMGNFIFDQTHTVPTRQGKVIKLHYYNSELKHIEIITHQVCGYHQTHNNLTSKYLAEEISLDELKSINETDGCVYFQPRPLDNGSDIHQEIMNRIMQFSEIAI
jgi:hypothetical protein